MTAVDLVVAPCTRRAAIWAVRRWHYAGTMPWGKAATVGAWESGAFVGALVFSRGGNHRIGSPYGLPQGQVAELSRVALDVHQVPTTAILARAVRLLRASSPGVRLLVSYADPAHGHIGRLYQAANWVHTGRVDPNNVHVYRVRGRVVHSRVLADLAADRDPGERPLDYVRRTVDPEAHRVRGVPPKLRYLYPLDRAMRRQLVPLALPYPRDLPEVNPR